MPAHWYLLDPKPIRGEMVCHTCDNPWCVRPDHLFLGSHADNMADMVRKKRSMAGVKNAASKLTEHQALVCKACPDVNGAATKLSRHFGVHVGSVSKVLRGVNWNHVGPVLDEHKAEALRILGSSDGTAGTVVTRSLTENQAKLARACPHNYGLASKLARAFNVTVGCIHNVRKGITWAHLPPPSEDDVREAVAFTDGLPSPKFGRPPR